MYEGLGAQEEQPKDGLQFQGFRLSQTGDASSPQEVQPKDGLFFEGYV